MTWRQYYERIDIKFTGPRYNICPSQQCIVLNYTNENVDARTLSWGFKPTWSRFKPLINAKAENLLESKMFKSSVQHKRCLVVADGFYEPKGESGEKNRPWFLFEYPDQRAFAIAGIWVEDGFAIITNDANDQVSPIHERMPHILPPEYWERWLDARLVDEAEISALLQPLQYDEMGSYLVGNYVKKPGQEGPQCVEKIDG
jgi:putative SOS response-associated peptidase YedK